MNVVGRNNRIKQIKNSTARNISKDCEDFENRAAIFQRK